MSPIQEKKVSAEIKINPGRTGIRQTIDMNIAVPRTTRFRSRATITAVENAESNQTAGVQGLVKTILRLRLRRCAEIMNKPRPAARKRRYPLRSSKIPRRALKL